MEGEEGAIAKELSNLLTTAEEETEAAAIMSKEPHKRSPN